MKEKKLEKIKEKECLDPATITTVGGFFGMAILQSIVGWIGLNFFKNFIEKLKKIFGGNKDESSATEVSGESTPKEG